MSGSYVNVQRLRRIQSVGGDGVVYPRAIVDTPVHDTVHYGATKVFSNSFCIIILICKYSMRITKRHFDLSKGIGCCEIIRCIELHVYKLRCQMYEVYRERWCPHLSADV